MLNYETPDICQKCLDIAASHRESLLDLIEREKEMDVRDIIIG